jgi:hypothetical protein
VTPDELRDRILRWDDPHTDFKEAVDNNSELAKDLVCFAHQRRRDRPHPTEGARPPPNDQLSASGAKPVTSRGTHAPSHAGATRGVR